MSSPTSSRTCRSRRRATWPALVPGAARRAGARGGAGPAGREGVHRRARHPGRPVPQAVDGPRRPAAALARRSAGPAILKTRRLGYDGKGQARRDARRGCGRGVGADRRAAGGAREARRASRCELSALVVRSVAGEMAFYDCPRNTHEGGILRRSVVPSGAAARPIWRAPATSPAGIADGARLRRRAGGRDVLPRRRRAGAERLMVNEIAPRVHNSGHWTIEACAVEPVREPHPRRRRLAAGHHRAAFATPR